MSKRKSPQILSPLLLLALLAGGLRPVSASSPAPQTDPQELETFFDGVMSVQMRENHLSGAVVVLVKDGEVFFSKGYGYTDLETRAPVDPATTLFRPGSVSKLFTWTAVMQLVEKGQLSLDENVNSYLDFKIPDTFPEPITMRHLMSHTPGFEDRGDGLFKLKAEEVISLEDYLKQNLPARVFPPGVHGAYSNYGTALAGYIIQRVSGEPFEEYIENHILQPLGMQHATFRQPLPGNLAPDLASGYNYLKGEYVKGDFEYVVASPAGALSAAGLDMAKFMIAHLQNGRYADARILEEETARQMHAQLFTHDPRISGMAYGFFESQVNGQRVISHGGDTLLFHSGLFLLPEAGTGLFISTSITNGGRAVEALWNAYMDRYFPAGDVPELSPAADFNTRAPLYTGEYYTARSNFTTFEKLFRAMSPATASTDGDEVVLSAMGQVMRFIEVEPGLLVDVSDPDNKMVMKEVDGQVYLYPSAPFTFIKAGPADSFNLHLIIYLLGALFFIIALVSWTRDSFRRDHHRSALSRAARGIAALFGLGYLALLIVIISQVMNILPAYNVPALFFGVPSIFVQAQTIIPLLLLLLALAMLVFSVLLWVRRSRGRLFYSVLTLFAGLIVWSLTFWNILNLG